MNFGFFKSTLLLLASTFIVQVAFCATLPVGKIVWWGKYIYRNEGRSTNTTGVIENDEEILTNVVAIAGGQWQGLALKNDGTVLGFGLSFYGGNDVPSGLSNVVSIAVEGGSCWAIKRDGTVTRWANQNGDQDEADVVACLSNVVSITWAGYRNYLALEKDGVVLGFRLDNPHPVVVPVIIQGEVLSNVVALAPMGFTPLALKKDGTVLSLGYQTPGKPPVQPQWESRGNTLYEYLGGESRFLPYRYTSIDPVIIDGHTLTNETALASDSGHVLALNKDGSVIAWDANYNNTATVPEDVSNIVAIATGQGESMALRRDGKVIVWGNNNSGQTVVPFGLSNVVAVASGGDFNMALVTGNVPQSVYITPHGRLEEMAREADLVFKGQALESVPITNSAFNVRAEVRATQFKLILVLQGAVNTNIITFQHYASWITEGWSGPSPPAYYKFKTGQYYLIFAANMSRANDYYSPSPGIANEPDVFHQIADVPRIDEEGMLRTLDSRPLTGFSVKDAHWYESNLLLHDSNPSNVLYAIDKLDQMSIAGGRFEEWLRSDDFRRKAVLAELLPLTTNANEQVALHAMNCYAVDPSLTNILEAFTGTFIEAANNGSSSARRLAAIGALCGTHFEAISNSLALLLENSDKNVRSNAVGLLFFYPGNFSDEALRKRAMDNSPIVRANVADVIGTEKNEGLLPTLVKLFSDPVGLKQPLPPLTMEELEGGGRSYDIGGDVHTSTGFALLNFDVDQVSNILEANLNDPGFRFPFLCKLAETNPKPWLDDMTQIMEIRRDRIIKQARANNFPPGPYLTLSGTYYRCWNIIYGYLQTQPSADFTSGKLNRYLNILETSGDTGSQEPTKLYELYRHKGLEKRASVYRRQCEKSFSYDLSPYFNRVDSEFTNSPTAVSQ